MRYCLVLKVSIGQISPNFKIVHDNQNKCATLRDILFSYYAVSCHIHSYCSMSDDEQESGCDTVDSSPASHTSGHSNSPFTERRYIADSNQNCEPCVACVAPETEPSKPTVRTVVVPPMRVQNNNNNNPAVSETHGNTGNGLHLLPDLYTFLLYLKGG